MRYRCQGSGLELEPVAEFGVDLAGVVDVEAAEGEGVVQQDAAVGDVGGGDGGGDVFAEGLAEGEVEGGVLREVGIGVARVGGRAGGIVGAVGEAGAVVDVGGGGDVAGGRGIASEVEGVALVA